MSITQFKNTAHAPLQESFPVAVPLGLPVAVTSVTCVERTDGVETGIWECTPGRWRRQIVATPIFLGIALLVMHIIGLIDQRPGLHDIETIAWRLLDFLSLITMVRLLKAIPSK